ncbi:sugar phosphate isomerase/epimerase (plasmid) [Sinorhizobium numidicum]|uniref:Sugar phosphate isomerase/epimerase n=1 Tax=Sinorhizobium numidicum TaxID=680248 RepID=A0ABY8D337_9HYPH|nr:TIM barrel protein [Sinorhizobium numidicum]WEX79321.1 sugar phosphate isomerase/epimerase [Sinorhizobium numidicum]WEX85308.1 sugar phosphate isomerase/epimerase [Sinorhizobium numidicum]
MTKIFLHSYGLRYQYRHRPGFDVFSLVDLAADLGFDGLNVSCFELNNYLEISGIEPAHLRKLRAYLEKRGILIDIETAGTEPAHLERLLGIAREVGAGYLRTYTNGTPDRRLRVEEAKTNLSQAALAAERAGIPVLLENHEDLAACEVAEILEHVCSPWIQGMFDYVNSMLFYEDPLTSLELMRPWIRSAHLKDCLILPPGEGGLLGVPIGAGHAPVAEMTAALVSSGVDRVCFENTWGYQAAMRDRRGSAKLGKGFFQHPGRPLREPGEYTHVHDLLARDPGRVAELEHWALRQSLQWLKAELPAFANINIPELMMQQDAAESAALAHY